MLWDLIQPINIKESVKDSKQLIMPHQSEAVQCLKDYYELDKDIPDRAGMLVMPTGSGKTYTAVTWLLSDAIAKGYTVVWLVHRLELVEQTFMEFRKQAPLLKETGVDTFRVLPVSGLHLRMGSLVKSNVYVCSVQSVANKFGFRHIRRLLGFHGKEKLLVVVDEAHHSVSASYNKIINKLRDINSNMALLGLTATPYRMSESEQARLQNIYHITQNIRNNKGHRGFIYEVTLKKLLESGFLAEPIYEKVDTNIQGEIEFAVSEEDKAYFERFKELSEKLKKEIARSSARNGIILEQYIKHQKKYGKTLIFAVNQMHAEKLCEEFNKKGITCDYAVSNRADSTEVIKRFKNNEFQVLINVQILTEGSDIPDVQTVFLTRQTNSDSLLMQMIGRALRGEKAGGTKLAYIVSFHDNWDKFFTWLDPTKLKEIDIVDNETEKSIEVVGEDGKNIEIAPSEDFAKVKELLKKLAQSEGIELPGDISTLDSTEDDESEISERDMYNKLYDSVRAFITSKQTQLSVPVGWYSVVDEDDGQDLNVMVFEEQLSVYQEIAHSLEVVKKLTAKRLIATYFGACKVKPIETDMVKIINFISTENAMPEYFTFEERKYIDPYNIAKVLLDRRKETLTEDDEAESELLKAYFEQYAILRDIYKIFFAFKKSVYDCMAEIEGGVIKNVPDSREEYEMVAQCFDLKELMDEVLEMYPKLNIDGLVELGWSNKVIKNWYALCTVTKDWEYYQIHVNKLLSSPQVDREVIKYLLFHELLHQNGYWDHDMEFRLREWQYPHSDELDNFLDSIPLKYKIDYTDAVSTEEYVFDAKYIPVKDVVIDEGVEVDIKIKTQAEENSKQEIVSDCGDKFNPTAKGVEVGFKYCMNCGCKLPEVANFCMKCGSKCEY